jgi:hypothetical protein
MKNFIIILMACILTYFIIKPNDKIDIITAKHQTDTIYYINSYKDSDLFLTKEQYLSFKDKNNDRIRMELPRYYLVLNGSYKDKVEVDKEEFNIAMEGKQYNE